ncbi:hypothetical protein [Xylocopilactobacillus apis]|uniref:Phospho-N-acetylmuramoyl-pentapeptide-transferase n=1 Tax=Xylocopilactobacillus apis TaxID=2932183 RepID=A0AAU9CQJ9_9LACO|nr:hypothetical protein [Xylocopilactobacillus apis]BDR56212.1 hypothetical protein KIMC2_07740 [Xylocopilactobacillus apis]
MKLTNNIIFKFILLFYSLFFVFKVDAKPTSMILIVGSFLITFLVFPIFIKFLKKSKDVQQIKEDGPTWHEKKAGTPTMGGFYLYPLQYWQHFVSLFITLL